MPPFRELGTISQVIELSPFPYSASPPASLQLFADLELKPQALKLSFNLRDPENLLMDSLSARHFKAGDLKRADGLWKSTCFEAFWALPGQPSYWEFNVSAMGQWNLYHFTQYRQPQPPQPSSDFKLVSLETTKERLVAELRCAERPQAFDVSLCSVLRTKLNESFYFANQHAGDKADFHLRKSMILRRQLLK